MLGLGKTCLIIAFAGFLFAPGFAVAQNAINAPASLQAWRAVPPFALPGIAGSVGSGAAYGAAAAASNCYAHDYYATLPPAANTLSTLLLRATTGMSSPMPSYRT
jgi:hypothetical protein